MTAEMIFLFQLAGTFWLLLEMRSRGRRLGQALAFMRQVFEGAPRTAPVLRRVGLSEVSR